MKTVSFVKGQWEDFLRHTYTGRFKCTPRIHQFEDCIGNGTNSEMIDGFDYITLMTHKRYGAGTKISAVCSFDAYGAPLMTFTDSLEQDENGEWRYSNYYEVVLWEQGVNVWRLYKQDGEIKHYAIASLRFDVPAGEKHEFSVELTKEGMNIEALGNRLYVRVDELPKAMFIGITACENINRYYSMSIDGEELEE